MGHWTCQKVQGLNLTKVIGDVKKGILTQPAVMPAL